MELNQQMPVKKTSWWHPIRNLLIVLAVIGGFSYLAFPLAAPLGLMAHPETRLAVFLVGSIVIELAVFGVLVLLL